MRKILLFTLVALIFCGCSTEKGQTAGKCLFSINCQTIAQKGVMADIVPNDGVIYPETEIEFYKGESVFDALKRTTADNGIQLEFSQTPATSSVYIEGLGNIYEFDGGELSGWIYKVNGEKPNISSSDYKLENGDKVEWLYTCDLGNDV